MRCPWDPAATNLPFFAVHQNAARRSPLPSSAPAWAAFTAAGDHVGSKDDHAGPHQPRAVYQGHGDWAEVEFTASWYFHFRIKRAKNCPLGQVLGNREVVARDGNHGQGWEIEHVLVLSEGTDFDHGLGEHLA